MKLPETEAIELIPEVVKGEPERFKEISEERSFEVDITLPN